MKESEMTARKTDARWHAVVKYRTGVGTLLDVEMYLKEIGDIQNRIERGRIGTPSSLSRFDVSIILIAPT